MVLIIICSPLTSQGLQDYYWVIWGPLHDQVPHFILSFYYYLLFSGDSDTIASKLSVLETVAEYMVNLGFAEGGVGVIPNASGLSDGGRHTANWCVAFSTNSVIKVS
jgi:hypothetical protein